jgi:hypothetical protein
LRTDICFDEKRSNMRKLVLAVAAGIITIPAFGIAVFTGAIASPTLAGATSPSGGEVSLWATANLTGTTSKIVVVGAIADSGVGTSVDKNGKLDPNGDFERIVFKKGSFVADATVLDQNASSGQPTLDNASTCSFAFSASGPITLSNGKGAYAGISGTLKVTEQFVGIGPRYKTGKNKGACNQSNNARPIAGAGAISGTGTVAFSS